MYPFREQWRRVLGIPLLCAATDESIKTKGRTWFTTQVLWPYAFSSPALSDIQQPP